MDKVIQYEAVVDYGGREPTTFRYFKDGSMDLLDGSVVVLSLTPEQTTLFMLSIQIAPKHDTSVFPDYPR